MPTKEEELRRLLADPRETLDLELKGWIDPSSPEGTAKIARGCIALRNNNGGLLVIGFTNTGLPDLTLLTSNVRETFHPDVVQGIVSKYSAEPFAVEVHFIERDGQELPRDFRSTGSQKPCGR